MGAIFHWPSSLREDYFFVNPKFEDGAVSWNRWIDQLQEDIEGSDSPLISWASERQNGIRNSE
jgi:hypothetical protein